MPIQRIRSAAHRRILFWLSQGPSTVSEIANEFDMRMPHASLACRQLRASGDIYRDDAAGIRKAPLYLSQSGLKRLENDALAKSKLHVETIPNGMDGIILQLDGSDVLIGYTQPPKSPLLFVADASIPLSTISNGNIGGAWILCQHQQFRWYDLETLAPTEPPISSGIGTLDEFNETIEKIGIVRGSIIERTESSVLLEGQWFSSPENNPTPTSFNHGQNVLGTVEGCEVNYAPPQGSHADLSSSLDRKLVLNAMSHDCLRLSEENSGSLTTLPIAVLYSWLQLRHPRMTAEKINARYEELAMLLRSRTEALPLPAKRDIVGDFGEVEWVEMEFERGTVNIYGMSPLGLRSVCEYILNHSLHPFVIEWPFPHPENAFVERILNHPMCQMVVTRNLDGETVPKASVSIKGSPHLAQLRVHLNRSTVLPLILDTSLEQSSKNLMLDVFPQHGDELLQAFASGYLDSKPFSRVIDDFEEQNAMLKAIDVYPGGNEKLANELESQWPIAAWIASPSEGRTNRWIRLQNHLPSGWIDLHPPSEFDLNTLAHSLHKGSSVWLKKAFRRLTLELRSSPEILLNISTAMNQGKQGSWLAAVVLGTASSLGDEFDELIVRSSSFWLDAPRLPEFVLPLLFPASKNLSDARLSLLKKWLVAAVAHPEQSFIRLWATMVQTIIRREPWIAENVRLAMENLPHTWWAPCASQWLLLQLNTSSGRIWLRDRPISWPALVARSKGELGGIPGAPLAHPGITLTSEDLLPTKLLSPGKGTSSLNDLYEMTYALEQRLPVPSLKTHPEGAWLVQPIDSWPTFSPSVIDEGDPSIGLLLYSRSFAARQQVTMD